MIDTANLMYCLKNGIFKTDKSLSYITNNLDSILDNINVKEFKQIIDVCRRNLKFNEYVDKIGIYQSQRLDVFLKFHNYCEQLHVPSRLNMFTLDVFAHNRTLLYNNTDIKDEEICKTYFNDELYSHIESYLINKRSSLFELNGIFYPTFMNDIYSLFYQIITEEQERDILKSLILAIQSTDLTPPIQCSAFNFVLPKNPKYKQNEILLNTILFLKVVI